VQEAELQAAVNLDYMCGWTSPPKARDPTQTSAHQCHPHESFVGSEALYTSLIYSYKRTNTGAFTRTKVQILTVQILTAQILTRFSELQALLMSPQITSSPHLRARLQRRCVSGSVRARVRVRVRVRLSRHVWLHV
jgi:hypothetical protein